MHFGRDDVMKTHGEVTPGTRQGNLTGWTAGGLKYGQNGKLLGFRPLYFAVPELFHFLFKTKREKNGKITALRSPGRVNGGYSRKLVLSLY